MSAVVKLEQATAQPVSIVDIMERFALNPSVDVAKLDKLIDVFQRVEKQRAETAYNAAMAAAQSEMVVVTKNAENKHTKSRYADLAAVSEAVTPIASKYGFGLSFSQCAPKTPNCIGVRVDVMHSAGHTKTYDYDVPIDATGLRGNDNKTATQAFGSTLSYGRRYAKLCVFDVATADDNDGNGARGKAEAPKAEFISTEQVAELQALIKDSGADLGRFLAFGKLSRLEDMPAAVFPSAKAKLLQKKAQQEKAAKAPIPDDGVPS